MKNQEVESQFGSAPLFFQVLFYPATVVGALLLHFYLQSVFETPTLQRLAPGIVALIAMGWTMLCERIYPFYRPWNQSQKDTFSDFLFTLLLLPIVMGVSENLLKPFSPAVSLWPSEWPFVVTLIVGVLVAEFFFYWVHWLSHRNAFLWRFHELHHACKRVYFLNSGRLHGVDAFFNFFFYFLPLILTGFPREAFLAFLTLTMVTGTLEHANVKFRAGILNYVFNTAELHRWHHSLEIEISRKNCGKITCFWDLVFGNFYLPKDLVGIEKIGTEDSDRVSPTASAG